MRRPEHIAMALRGGRSERMSAPPRRTLLDNREDA